MPKGLDPNASFRRPVDTTLRPLKILVDAEELEMLLDGYNRAQEEWDMVAAYREIIADARKAQESHRG